MAKCKQLTPMPFKGLSKDMLDKSKSTVLVIPTTVTVPLILIG